VLCGKSCEVHGPRNRLVKIVLPSSPSSWFCDYAEIWVVNISVQINVGWRTLVLACPGR
jgi:hypothetical protein